MVHRLIINWVYGGFLAGILLLLLAPLFVHDWPPALAAAFFCLPAYMLHQYQEHDNDRFRIFMNRFLASGYDVLSLPAVFIINVPGLWGVMALSLWLAARVDPGLVLIAVYVTLFNAMLHIAHAIVTRGYNPGLVSSIVLFLPVCAWCLRVIRHSGFGTPGMHAIGASVAVGGHAVIAVWFFRKRRKYA
jgi:hypothetical protein